MVKKKDTLIIVLIAFVLFIGFRLCWIFYYQKTDYPEVNNGVLDLREVTIKETETISLDGEWEFFRGKWIDPTNMELSLSKLRSSNISMPENFINNANDKDNSRYQYGTYRVRILLNPQNTKNYNIYFKDLRTSSIVYVNGKKIDIPELKGIDAKNINYLPMNVHVGHNQKEIDLVVYVSNQVYPYLGAMLKSVELGTYSAIQKERLTSVSMQFLSVSVLLLHGIYTLIIFLFFVRKKEFLYLFIAFLCVALSVLIDDDRIIIYLFPGISYKWWMILYYFSYLSSVYFLFQFVKSLRDKKIDKKSFVRVLANIYQVLYFIFLICILVDPFKKEFMFAYAVILYFGLMLGLWYVFKGISIARREFLFYFWATVCVASSYIWGAMRVIGIVDYFPYYPLDIIIGVITFSTYWFKRFFDTSKKSKELALELQAIDKKREEFLANTSHELRNPLHGIMNIAQTVYENEENQLNDENKQNLRLLMRVSQRMSLILNDLLDITKLKDGSLKLQMGQVNLLSVVLNVFDTLRFMTEGKDIKFIIHDSELFLIVKADENRLFQILFNLVHNAVKYTNHGKIIISCDVRDGKAFIKVEDTGIGMDEETIESIFEPYKQADSSMTSIAGGIGLGLSICDQLVKLHGGVLSVSSTLGKGSIFMFTLQTIPTEEQLPLERVVMFGDVKEQHERVKEPSKLNEDIPKVLVVDDDSINLQILETILEAETFNVVTCTSGKEALELLDKGNWDLVITDVMMPYMSGYELTQRIRERFKISELPILLLTARSQLEDIQAGFYYGANDYVMKPVEKLELTARVRALTQLKLSINERVRMEAAWLQAQIQPHFLFNTFNTIAALSEVNPSKMIDLLTEFGNYLRASFDMQNLNPVVPLQHELDLVQSYIYIQQERFRDRLKVEWDIDDQLDAQVPPLTIQTIVENAINHGVLKRSNGGTVRISINHQQQGVLISIVDNGVGMTENQLQELLTYPLNEQQGIGLLNTDKRLKQLYGSGLIIQSVLNEGTVVSFLIPKGEKERDVLLL